VTPTNADATYHWVTEYDPTIRLNRVKRVRGPDPRAVLASSAGFPPPPPPPKEPYHFRPDNDDAQGFSLEKSTTAPSPEQIVAWRKQQGLTQTALAKLAGTSRGAVAMVEGRTRAAKATRRKLGLALGKTEADW
jgi:DNA-binding XRE family transcriptional regulator